MKNQTVISLVLNIVIGLCLTAILFSVLVTSHQLYYPFVVAKTFIFNVSVELLFVAFLALAWVDKNQALRFNWAVLLLGLHISILFLASLLGNDFYRSFWSNAERSEGLLLLVHLFLWVWVLSSYIRSRAAWLRLFDLFLISSLCVSLVGVDQFLALHFPDIWQDHVVHSSFEHRLSSTIGNPGYVAVYTIFAVFLSIYLFGARSAPWLKAYYVAVFTLSIFIIVNTYTRGAFLALMIGVALLLIYQVGWVIKNKLYRRGVIGLLLVGMAVLSAIFIYKDSAIIQENTYAQKITTISLTHYANINRIATWNSAWQGIKQRPLLGYGQENFYQVFDQYYQTHNTEPWWDRAHNFIFDHAISGGLLGLLSYLALIFVPLWFAFKFYAENHFVPVLFAILLITYLIQNLFTFDALVTYIPLMMIVSFLGFFSPPLFERILKNKITKRLLFAFGLVLLPFSLYYFNVKPLWANAEIYRTVISTSMPIEQRVASFEKVLAQQTPGNQEFRRLYLNLFENIAMNILQNNEVDSFVSKNIHELSNKIALHLDNQIKENPHNVVNHLMRMHFCNFAHTLTQPCFEKALISFNRAVKLSPGRPQVYHEGALTYFILANEQVSIEAIDKAVINYGRAVDIYYKGAMLEHDIALRFDQMIDFLRAATTHPIFITTLLDRGVAGKNSTEFIAELSGWINTANLSDKENKIAALKQIILNILQIDPENIDLKRQWAALK